MIALRSALSLEGVAHPCIPLPRSIDIAACGGFYIQIEMGIMTEVKVRADAEFPPAAAEVGLEGRRCSALRHRHRGIALEIIEVGRTDL